MARSFVEPAVCDTVGPTVRGGDSMSRPRILHLRASNFVGGPEHQLLRYAEAERSGPYEIWLGTFVGEEEGEDFLRAIEARGLTAISLSARNSLPSFRSVMRTLRENRISLVCTHGYKADILGVLAGRILGVPVACFLRGWTGENRKVRSYEFLDRLVLPLADRIVCLSANQAARLTHQKFLSKKIRVVVNSIDTPPFHTEQKVWSKHELARKFGVPLESRLVASAGRLSPEKGVTEFLKAARQILEIHPDTCFLVFGDGALRNELELLVTELGLSKSVRFAGFLKEIRNLLPGLDVFVNPSLSEEMPNVILEAMAASVPVVATAVGGVPDIAGSSNWIVLVPPGDPPAIAKAVSDLLKNPWKANELARRGYERVRESFSLETQKAGMDLLYEELLPYRAFDESKS